MKKFIIPMLFVVLAVSGYAQTNSTVPVSPQDKIAIESSKKKLDDLQAQGNTLSNAYKTSLASLNWSFNAAGKAFTDSIGAAKKHLGLPDDAVFDPSTFTFSIPAPKPPAPVTPPAPVAPTKTPATPEVKP